MASQAKLGTDCSDKLVLKIPKKCGKDNCPFICTANGMCSKAPVSKEDRLQEVERLIKENENKNIARDRLLIIQMKQLTNQLQGTKNNRRF